MTLSENDRQPRRTRGRRRAIAVLLGATLVSTRGGGRGRRPGRRGGLRDRALDGCLEDRGRTRPGAARRELAAPEVPLAGRAAGERPRSHDVEPGFSGEAPVVYPAQVRLYAVVIYANGPDGVYQSAGTHRVAGADRRRRDVEPRARRAEGDRARQRVLRQAQRGRPRTGHRRRAAHRCPAGARSTSARIRALRSHGRRERARSRGREPGQAGDREPQALRGERAGARTAVQLVEHGRAHVQADLRPAVRDRGAQERSRQPHVLVQPGQRRLGVRERDPHDEPARGLSASRAT